MIKTNNYVINLNLPQDIYDIYELDAMLQQVLAIHLGWADQIEPFYSDPINENYTWERI